MKKALAESSSYSKADQPGAFAPDGSFLPDAGWAQQGPTDTLVRSLVRQRRSGVALGTVTSLVRSSGQLGAFPSIEQWESCGSWLAVWAQTSAEEAVKRAGYGASGHWCGSQPAPGPEKDCTNPLHKTRPTPEDVARLTATLIDALGDRS